MDDRETTEGCSPPKQEGLPTAANPIAGRLVNIHAAQSAVTSSPYSHDMVELAIATATSLPISNQDDTAPVWLLIAGPPSSDKTATVQAMKGATHVLYIDTFTENAIASGYVDPVTGRRAKSLVTELNGKCLIIKDLTTLFSLRDDKVRKVLGDFTSLYDGEYHKYTGTIGKIGGEAKLSMMACITPAALFHHHRYLASIGSRFLIYLVRSLTDAERDDGLALTWDIKDRTDALRELRDLVGQHVNELLTTPVNLQPEAPVIQDKINRLSKLLAHGRGAILYGKHPKPDKFGGERWVRETDAVQVEEPFRAVHQLKNLGRALARVHGRAAIIEHEIELLRRVVLGSMPADRAGVLALFPDHPNGITRKECVEGIGKSYHRAQDLLQELVVLKVLIKEVTKGQLVYLPSPDFKDLIVAPITPLDHVADLTSEIT